MELSETKIGEIKGLLKAIRQIGSGNEDLEKLVDEIEGILTPSLTRAIMEVCAHLRTAFYAERPLSNSKPEKTSATAKDAPPPYSKVEASLPARILADPKEVIEEIKAMWAYLHKGKSIADSAIELNTQQLISALQSLPLGKDEEHLGAARLGHLLNVSARMFSHMQLGEINMFVKGRLAEVFGYAGGAANDAGSKPGKASSDAKAPEGHTDASPAKNGLPDGEYLITEARNEKGEVVERKVEPIKCTGKTAVAPIAPEEAPKKKGRPKADCSAAPAMSAEYRGKLIRQVQAIIDEARTDNVSRILDRIQDAGIRLGKIAELLDVDVKEVYAIRGGRNKPLERKFWKIFAKPNLSSRNNISEEA